MTSIDALTDYADKYAGLGLRVLPYNSRDNRCTLGRWPDGDYVDYLDAYKNCTKHPDRGIGDLLAIRTGDFIDVLDIDSQSAHANLVAALGPLPPFYNVLQTPSGGYHYYLPALGIGNATNMLDAEGSHDGVDYRGRRGIVFAPPSQRASKINGEIRGYVSLVFCPVEEMYSTNPAVSAHAWRAYLAPIHPDLKPKPTRPLYQFPKRPTPTTGTPGTRAAKWFAAKVVAKLTMLRYAQPGERNTTLNNVALDLGHYVPTGYVSEETLTDWLMESCARNGLIDDDGVSAVTATIRSGMRKGMSEPRHAPSGGNVAA